MKTGEVLRQALAAFGQNGENWTQGQASYCDPLCCTTLAFFRIHPEISGAEMDAGLAALGEVLGEKDPRATEEYGLQDWNDAPGRTWPEVKALFEAAIGRREATQ